MCNDKRKWRNTSKLFCKIQQTSSKFLNMKTQPWLLGLNETKSSPSFLDTYSADFQKCPGWDSLRLSLGSFSSMSASWVKVGLSLKSYAQQAERISWEDSSFKSAHCGLSTKIDLTCTSWLTVSTHSDLLAEADLCQDLLDALSAPHLPDGGFHRLVGDWPVPSLKLIPNGA